MKKQVKHLEKQIESLIQDLKSLRTRITQLEINLEAKYVPPTIYKSNITIPSKFDVT